MNNKIFLLIVLLVSLTLLITPVFAEDRNNDSNSNDDDFDSNEDILVGGDRDSHGCIPSAGYSWCEGLQKCIRSWEEKCFESPVPINECVCTFQYDPVCGINGVTYGNSCVANCAQVKINYSGECRSTDSNVGDSNVDDLNSCICTKEYAPVCALIKDPNCVCPDGAMCKCASVKKTFSNKCMAKCAGVSILREGACEDPIIDSNEVINNLPYCGGVNALKCKEGYTCVMDTSPPDVHPDGTLAVPLGKCVYDCPQYMPPLCKDGNVIVVKVDEHGCKKPVCLSVTSTTTINQSDFYLGANWVCSNGKEYKEKSEKCMPASYWKETARKTCAQFSKCDSNVIQRPISPATGNFILDLVARAMETSTTTKPISNNTTSNNDSNREIIATTSSTLPPCVGKNVFVNSFEFSEECRVNCDVVIDSEGCKNISCMNGEVRETKRYCDNECFQQSSEEIVKLKEKCYAVSGQLVIKTNDQGCTKYFCDRSNGYSDDSNNEEIYANLNCTLLNDLPKEKYVNCESNGGKLLVKTNSDNCITVLECVSIENEEIDSNKLNKEIIKDSVQLLALALRLEDLKIELDKTTIKVQAISDYYEDIGDNNSELRFQNASDLLKIASNEVAALKKMIKERAENFTETDALEVKRAVKSIKNELLNKVLMILLE